MMLFIPCIIVIIYDYIIVKINHPSPASKKDLPAVDGHFGLFGGGQSFRLTWPSSLSRSLPRRFDMGTTVGIFPQKNGCITPLI